MNNRSISAPPSIGQKLDTTPTTTVAKATNPVGNSHVPRAASAAPPKLFAMKPFLESEQPAKGVVLVTNSDPTVLAVAIAAIWDGIVRNHSIVDQPVLPVSKIVFLHPSGSRGPVPLKAFTSKDIQAHVQMVPISYCNRFNPLASEGVHILMSDTKPGECVFALVKYNDLTHDVALVALAELNAKVEELGALLVIFVLHTKKQDASWLQDHCGAFVEVGKCEPGPDAQAAIALTNVSLSSWHPYGIGRVMVEAFFEPDGGWTYRSEPFIAERAIIRLSWHLRFKQVTVEQIAKVISIHKSNVSRGLDSLLIPPDNTVGLAPPKGSRKRWIGRYPDVENIWPLNKPEPNVGTGVVGEAAKISTPSKQDNTGHVANGGPAPDRTHPAPPNNKP